MTDAQQREAARQFFYKWNGKGKEDEDARSYWIDILQNISAYRLPRKLHPQGPPHFLLSIFEPLQDEVAVLSDELDSDTLEEAEAAIDVVIDKFGDVIEENGWDGE